MHHISALYTLLFLLCGFQAVIKAAEPEGPPNIVIILIDDLGWADLVCQGSTFYETPNLDRMAQEGMRFTHGYAACTVCSPSRAAIQTGRTPAGLHLTNYIPGNIEGPLMPPAYRHHLDDEPTIASLLKGAHYRTAHIGKWHLGGEGHHPEQHGYDRNFGGSHAGHTKSYFAPYKNVTLPNSPEGEFITERLTDACVNIINEWKDEHYFINFCHYTVHTPLQAPEALVKKYQEKAQRLGLGKPEEVAEEDIIPVNKRRIQYRKTQSHPVYAAMIETMDTSVGKVLAAIDATPHGKNTIVIFTSDNGGLATTEGSPTSNAPLARGKGWGEEGGVRVPFIVRWPAHIKPGTICETPVIGYDILPTVMDILKRPIPTEVEGVSILPLLRGEALAERPLFWHYPHYSPQGGRPYGAVRRGDWKLIEGFENRKIHLYNVVDDIGEINDLAESKPELAQELTTLLRDWQDKTKASMPTPNSKWK